MVLVTEVNLLFSVVILALGIWVYYKKHDEVPLYIGVAYGLFRVWDVAEFFNLENPLGEVIVRAIGYCLVIFAIYRLWKR